MADTNRVVKRTKALALAVREKVNIIKSGWTKQSHIWGCHGPLYTMGNKHPQNKLLRGFVAKAIHVL
eukprot:4557454-Heterocapsa_arctica.AAC.1